MRVLSLLAFISFSTGVFLWSAPEDELLEIKFRGTACPHGIEFVEFNSPNQRELKAVVCEPCALEGLKYVCDDTTHTDYYGRTVQIYGSSLFLCCDLGPRLVCGEAFGGYVRPLHVCITLDSKGRLCEPEIPMPYGQHLGRCFFYDPNSFFQHAATPKDALRLLHFTFCIYPRIFLKFLCESNSVDEVRGVARCKPESLKQWCKGVASHQKCFVRLLQQSAAAQQLATEMPWDLIGEVIKARSLKPVEVIAQEVLREYEAQRRGGW